MSVNAFPAVPSANALPTLNAAPAPAANQALPLGDVLPAADPYAADAYAPSANTQGVAPSANQALPANTLGADTLDLSQAPTANQAGPAPVANELPPELVQTVNVPSARSSSGLGVGSLVAGAAGAAGAWWGLIPRFFAGASSLAKGGIVGAAALGATALFSFFKNKLSAPKPQQLPVQNAQFAPQGLPAQNEGPALNG